MEPESSYLIHKCPPPVRILNHIDPVSPRPLWMVRNRIHFYGEELLAPRPTPKLYGHPLSAVRDIVLYIFAATIRIGGRFFIRNWGRAMP
jgi:hypothetical protein